MKSTRYATLACSLCFFVIGMAATLLGPTYQNLARRFELPLENAGLFTSLVFAGSVVTTLATGRLLDRLNARYVLCGGALVAGSGLLLLSVAPTLPVAFLALLILGLGSGALNLTPNVVVAAIQRENTAGALNTLNLYFSVGAIIGPLVVNFLASHQSFTLAYAVIGILIVLLVVPFSQVSVFVQNKEHTGPRPGIRWATLLPFTLMFFIGVGMEIGFSSWIYTQLSKAALASDTTAALATSLFWAGQALSRGLAGIVLRHVSERNFLTCILISLAVGAGLLLIAPTSPTIGLLSAFVVGVSVGPVFPTMMGIASKAYPQGLGTASGVLVAGGQFGGSILPWLQGQVGGGTSGGMALTVTASLILVALVNLTRRVGQPQMGAESSIAGKSASPDVKASG